MVKSMLFYFERSRFEDKQHVYHSNFVCLYHKLKLLILFIKEYGIIGVRVSRIISRVICNAKSIFNQLINLHFPSYLLIKQES